MTIRGPAQTSEPVVQYLYQLIDAIRDGKLLIPRFQRPLVWRWDLQSELLCSVKDGIPMGAIVLWRTSNDRITWRGELAGHLIPAPPVGMPREYILDGLQRLSTLFAALRGFGNASEEDGGPRDPLGYDLEEQVFVESFDASQQPQVIPLYTLPDSLTLVRFQRGLKGKQADEWIERSDELAQSFREYKVPVIPIVSEDFEMAARTFTLINRQGVRRGDVDMIHALTWTPEFELQDQMESLRSEVLQPVGWGGIEFDDILKIVKAEADLDLHEESVEQVSNVLKRDPDALERPFEHLAQVADLLRKRCGILNWELVPYSMQAVLMADAFRVAGKRKNTGEVRGLLADWFWLTTYGEMFAGLSGYRLGIAIRDLRNSIEDGEMRWSGASSFRVRPIPASADFRAVRMKAVALLLARRIKDSSSSTTDPFRTLAEYGRSAMFALIPRRSLSKTSFSSPGNRFLCAPEAAVELKQRILALELNESDCLEHVISKAAIAASQAGDWDRFVAERLKSIIELEDDFVRAVLERHPIAK
jgi:hypothetical protein